MRRKPLIFQHLFIRNIRYKACFHNYWRMWIVWDILRESASKCTRLCTYSSSSSSPPGKPPLLGSCPTVHFIGRQLFGYELGVGLGASPVAETGWVNFPIESALLFLSPGRLAFVSSCCIRSFFLIHITPKSVLVSSDETQAEIQ